MSPRTPQQFKEMREEKMTLIMDVALEHFANEGYYKTTISHIARHARMSKGLMYNYFESKEALLKAIIHKSVNEIYKYLDIDRDGFLSEEDFKFFIRKINVLLKEKRYFWQLLMQLIVQNDVREQFLKAFPESDSLIHPGHEPGDNYYPSQILKMFTDYFSTKREKMGKLFDSDSDFEMFFITLLGYAIKTIYSESNDAASNEKEINSIIELFK
jgi:AcrR family transcriptional regulator